VVKAGSERSEIIGDPVRQYLREMGNVNLLSRAEEISIARKIERGEKKVIKALSKTNVVLNRVIELGRDVLDGHKSIDDVIDVSEDIYDESKKQELTLNQVQTFIDISACFKYVFSIGFKFFVIIFKAQVQLGYFLINPFALGGPG